VTSIREEPRVALIGEFASPSGPLVVMTTHLGFVPGWNGRQLRALCRRLAGFQAPVVILGDLNMHNPRAAQRMGYRQLATLRTYPGNEPRRQLDHILLRGDLGRIVSTSAPAFAVSDHRALTVEILVDDRMSGEHAAGERTAILEG
jgi:endonuclease/exonuclease/phosphatase family metal-dependent hydrolase